MMYYILAQKKRLELSRRSLYFVGEDIEITNRNWRVPSK